MEMQRRRVDNPGYEELEGMMASRGSESPLEPSKTNGIDYLQDVNATAKDLINLLRGTVEAMEQSLRSGNPDLVSPARSLELSIRKSLELEPTKNDNGHFLLEETRNVCSAEPDDKSNEINRSGISQSASTFLTAIRFLVDYTENRMNVSPMQQQRQERELRQAVRSNAQTEMNMRSLNDSLLAQRTEHEKTLDELKKKLNTCRENGDEVATEVRNEINRIVNESESKMVEIYKESLVKENLLHSKIRIVQSRLTDLRKSNIIAENELRGTRCQVETQLINFLAKYDADIGGRHMEMENLANEFQLLDSERKSLENDVMVDLRMLHDDLQREKAAALLKLLNERVDKFVRNRAARVIQKAWRAYWERHCAKKKKKSRKK